MTLEQIPNDREGAVTEAVEHHPINTLELEAVLGWMTVIGLKRDRN